MVQLRLYPGNVSKELRMYAIERDCKEKNLSFDAINAVRQEQSIPVLNSLGKWMKDEYVGSS